MVSFATYGLLAGELPCRSEPALVFTPPEQASALDDGLLEASEIARAQTSMRTGSSCRRATRRDPAAGSAARPSRRPSAFFYAGARSLLVSHWEVASNATVMLMTDTFRAYARDPSAGEAAALDAGHNAG